MALVCALIAFSPLTASAADRAPSDTDVAASIDQRTGDLRQKLDSQSTNLRLSAPMTAADRAYDTAKSAAATKYAADKAQGNAMVTPKMCPPSDPCGPTSRYLDQTMSPQETNYWCGPAAVQASLRQRGTYRSQTQLAVDLDVGSSGGTYWGEGRTAPVPRVMNTYGNAGAYWIGRAVAYSATADDKARFVDNLVYDIDRGYPILGNAYQVKDGPHLNGHPLEKAIQHWYEIRGYYGSGYSTAYADPAAGAPSISWSANVPRYSSLASDYITRINGGRGYVW